jgi:hypothetical protein
MKKIQFVSLALVTLLSFSFQSCVKEEPVAPVNERTSIIIAWPRSFNSCWEGSAFCIRLENISEREAAVFPLGTDEALSQPLLRADGSVQLKMEMEVADLSPQARMIFFEEKELVIDEDFALSETTMRQAYENAGLPYAGQRVEVLKGLYPIVTENGDGAAPQRIKITITIKDGKLTITIKW